MAAATVAGLTTDQRGAGFARVVSSKVDIGALETQLQTPTVTNASTTENTQTTSGLVITPAAADAAVVTNFQITGITGGTLFLNDGTTPITNGEFITVAQGAAGLKFTPTTGSLASGSFTAQESTSAAVGGLGGTTATATITVALAGPTVTSAITTENTQTTSGLVITPGANDSSAAYFQITGITGGTLYQNNGTTPIANGSFITVAQGEAGLKFTPTTGSLASGSFTAQESTSAAVGGLGGTTATATITVALAGPTVTSAVTTENTQTTAGLVITPGANDSTAAYFQITGITGGTLYQNNGTTPISSGSFITVAQGEAGLKFTPTTGSLATGSFNVKESTTNARRRIERPDGSGHDHRYARRTVGDERRHDGKHADHCRPGDHAGCQRQHGSLLPDYRHHRRHALPEQRYDANRQRQLHHRGSRAAGLKFTPTTGSLATGSFSVEESTTNFVSGLSGATATGTIAVTLAGPSVTSAVDDRKHANHRRPGDHAGCQRQHGSLFPDYRHHRRHALPE